MGLAILMDAYQLYSWCCCCVQGLRGAATATAKLQMHSLFRCISLCCFEQLLSWCCCCRDFVGLPQPLPDCRCTLYSGAFPCVALSNSFLGVAAAGASWGCRSLWCCAASRAKCSSTPPALNSNNSNRSHQVRPFARLKLSDCGPPFLVSLGGLVCFASASLHACAGATSCNDGRLVVLMLNTCTSDTGPAPLHVSFS